jgi:hypothetical protein
LLDLLEDGGDSSDLNDADAMTGSEALADGAAILDEIYGSKAAAMKALGASGAAEEKAAALSATAVMATLAASNAAQLSSDRHNRPQIQVVVAACCPSSSARC